MNVHIKFLILSFLKSFFYVLIIMTCLVFILNLLSELEFFKEINVEIYFTLFLSLLNTPSTIFEMLPFILLITTQLFFIKLFNNNEIEIFKYSGTKNSKIITTVSIVTFVGGIIFISLFYNFSSSFKNFYLEIKSKYTSDGKYLAVITNNGLWIKDEINDKILIVNSSEIKQNFLINNFITEFDSEYNVIRNLRSEKIDITSSKWKINKARIYEKNNYEIKNLVILDTNFDYKRIQSLYSNLSSLNFLQLYELRENYKKLNYSLTEINIQLLKLISYPLYLLLITIFSSIIMLNTKRLEGTTVKISIGLFFSVIIYYMNNFFHVMGNTERISVLTSVLLPLIILSIVNFLMINKINEK